MSISGPKSGLQSQQSPQERICSLLHPASGGYSYSLSCGCVTPFFMTSIFKSHSALSSHYCLPCIHQIFFYLRLTRIDVLALRTHLDMQDSLISICFITFPKAFCFCHIRLYSQVMRIRMLIPFEDPYSAYHREILAAQNEFGRATFSSFPCKRLCNWC